MVIFNVLAKRYVTPELTDIFDESGKIISERELWIAVMKAQKELGLNISSETIEKFEKAKRNVDFKRIKEIEDVVKHDVKARIQHFVEVAQADEKIHLGMTARDLTDNVEQMQIKKASELIFGRYVSVLRHMLDKAGEYRDIFLTARTHHQAAQPTLLGRRFSMWAEELNFHLTDFEIFLGLYPLRGIKGPVGTQSDMLSLLKSEEKVSKLELKVAQHLGFNKVLSSTGQIYPRSLDFTHMSRLVGLAAACENFATGMRLMAGYDLVTEGFKEGQVGSSAMPHKMNTPHSERIHGLGILIKMYLDGASRISGDQWEEGDVSDSVVRRVIGPDAFFASDALCETTLDVLNNMGTYPVIITREVDRYLPFLATTQILSAAIEAGIGREKAHGIIKKYSVAEALKMRNGEEPKLAEKLGNEPEFLRVGITTGKIKSILGDKKRFIGLAHKQIDDVLKAGAYFLTKYTKEAAYEPRPIL